MGRGILTLLVQPLKNYTFCVSSLKVDIGVVSLIKLLISINRSRATESELLLFTGQEIKIITRTNYL